MTGRVPGREGEKPATIGLLPGLVVGVVVLIIFVFIAAPAPPPPPLAPPPTPPMKAHPSSDSVNELPASAATSALPPSSPHGLWSNRRMTSVRLLLPTLPPQLFIFFLGWLRLSDLAMAEHASDPSLQCDMSISRKPVLIRSISPSATPPQLSSPFQARESVAKCLFSTNPSARAAAPVDPMRFQLRSSHERARFTVSASPM